MIHAAPRLPLLVALLVAAAAPAAAADPAEEAAADEHPLGLHRIRATLGWSYYPGGVTYASSTGPTPVDIHGFRVEVGYQLQLYRGLVLDALVGGTFAGDVEASRRSWSVYSGAAGLGWVWTSFPYVLLGVRGGFAAYAMVPNVGDLHYLTAFRAGAWVEVPLLDWFALHAGMDLGLGAYIGRDDKALGFLIEAGLGATFFFGGGEEPGADAPSSPEPAPGPAAPSTDELGRGWQ